MLRIEVFPPVKTASRYEFRCTLTRPLGLRERLRRVPRALLGRARPRSSVLRFGFEAANYEIRHHEIWDSVFPLMYLIRNGGPLFNRGHDAAEIAFRYPILAPVRDFYVRRAAAMGIALEVDAPLYDARTDLPTAGHVLAFGGGKDSRTILGTLRERGIVATLVTSGAHHVLDLPDALVTSSLSGVLADRVMPAVMALGREFYFGSGLGEVHRETPWHQYYDWASPVALAELSALLRSLGIEMRASAPAAVLPYNLTQKIVFERYPELYRFQYSVEKDERSKKNLQVSLCKLYHGIEYRDSCNEALFRDLLREFVERQMADPAELGGYRNCLEPIHREMRAIIHARRAARESALPSR